MEIRTTSLPGVLIVEPVVWRDPRGWLLESWQHERYAAAGIGLPFVQDNRSRSIRGTVRGLHLQVRRPQGKLVQVVRGEVFDVAVDVRPGSPTFGRWAGEVLSEDNARQMWIPPGFAHGFAVTTEDAVVEYKCTAPYDRESEVAVRWNDPEIGIDWPVATPLLSEKDATAPLLREVLDRLPAFAAVVP